jgi:hypothetical protein
MSMTDEERRQRVLARAELGQVTVLGTLTDEEIVALEGTTVEQLTMMPHYDVVADKRGAVQAAARSLVAHGFALPHEDRSTRVTPSDDIADVLATRRGTPVLMVIERELADTKRWSYCLFYGESVIEEQISDDGFHTFAALASVNLAQHLVGLLDPISVADDQQSGLVAQYADLDEFLVAVESMPEVAQSVAVSTLTMMQVNPDRMETAAVYISPQGAFILRMVEDRYHLSRATRQDLGQLIHDLIRNVVAGAGDIAE